MVRKVMMITTTIIISFYFVWIVPLMFRTAIDEFLISICASCADCLNISLVILYLLNIMFIKTPGICIKIYTKLNTIFIRRQEIYRIQNEYQIQENRILVGSSLITSSLHTVCARYSMMKAFFTFVCVHRFECICVLS